MISFGEERKRGERKYHRAFVFETISRQNEKFDSYFTRLLRLLVCVYVRICCVCKLRRRFTETRRRFPSSSPSLSQLETAQSCGRSTGCKLKQRAERGGPRFNYRRVSRYIRDVETTTIRTRARLFRDDDEQQAEQRSRQTLCIAIRLNSPPVNEDFNLFSPPLPFFPFPHYWIFHFAKSCRGLSPISPHFPSIIGRNDFSFEPSFHCSRFHIHLDRRVPRSPRHVQCKQV